MPESLNLASTATETTTAPSPDKTLTIYRHSKKRIFTFEPSTTSPAEYVIAASTSRPLLHRGPIADSLSSSPIIDSLRSTSFW